MENPLSVSHQLGSPLHGGIFPDDDLVVDVAMAGDQLLVLPGPDQTAHLGLGVGAVHHLPVAGVPDLDGSVRCAATTGQDVGLPGAPSQGLHGSLVFAQGGLGTVQMA